MIVDQFLNRKYDENTYNCLHFTREVWLALTGEDIGTKLHGLLGQASDRRLMISHFRAFERLTHPIPPCIMYMTQLDKDPHIGVVLADGLLHIRRTGPEFFPIPLASRGATPPFRYYR